MVPGHFAERHFAERHFAERHFAERTFCRRTLRLHKQSNNNRYELLMTHYALIYGSDRTMVIL